MTEREHERLFKAWADATARSTPELNPSVRQKVLSASAKSSQRSAFPRNYRWALAGLALAAVAVLLLVLRTPAPPSFRVAGRPAEVGSWLEAAPTTNLGLNFSEGTRVLFSKSSRGRVSRVSRGGARVELASGSLQADVVHRSGADWSFGAGPFDVTVTGTRLNVAWAPAAGTFDVSVARGSVLVQGPFITGLQEVRAGQICHVDLARRVMELGRLSAEQAKAPAEGVAPAEAASATESKPAEPAAAPSSVAPASRAAAAESADALLEEARAARLSGRSDLERAALLACRKRAKGQSAAAQAAYLLGKASKAAEAAAWFQTYLREEPRGLLAREAAGRLIESYRAAGDDGNARQAASRYLARYPNGPHAALAQQALAARSESQD